MAHAGLPDLGLVEIGMVLDLVARQRLRTRRHRTLSLIAAIVGLVPIAGAVLTGLLFGGQLR